MEIKLSEIKQVNTDSLRDNPLNGHFFDEGPGRETDQLFNDIKERGIIVPLIAKKDGTLIAGHRRLFVAQELKMKTVPVQYVESELSKNDEKNFLIKDNVLRRHLTPKQREALYRLLIPNFDKKIMNRGSKTSGVNLQEAAELTGLNPKTISYDFTHIRQKKESERIQKSEADIVNEKHVENYKRALAKMLNISAMGSKSTNAEFLRLTKLALKKLENVS